MVDFPAGWWTILSEGLLMCPRTEGTGVQSEIPYGPSGRTPRPPSLPLPGPFPSFIGG